MNNNKKVKEEDGEGNKRVKMYTKMRQKDKEEDKEDNRKITRTSKE